MGRVRRKRKPHHNANHAIHRTRRYTRDQDQIHADLSNETTRSKLLNQPLDESKPGMGQYYCIECARYMESREALLAHSRSKQHKRRFKRALEMPYSQQEADAAVGLLTETEMKALTGSDANAAASAMAMTIE